MMCLMLIKNLGDSLSDISTLALSITPYLIQPVNLGTCLEFACSVRVGLIRLLHRLALALALELHVSANTSKGVSLTHLKA